MIAIIQTGGKQYLVATGNKIQVEKLNAKEKATVKFETLFTGDESTVQIGTPRLKIVVEGRVLRHDRHEKVTGIKHKAKKRELTRYGHRQLFTEVEITKVS